MWLHLMAPDRAPSASRRRSQARGSSVRLFSSQCSARARATSQYAFLARSRLRPRAQPSHHASHFKPRPALLPPSLPSHSRAILPEDACAAFALRAPHARVAPSTDPLSLPSCRGCCPSWPSGLRAALSVCCCACARQQASARAPSAVKSARRPIDARCCPMRPSASSARCREVRWSLGTSLDARSRSKAPPALSFKGAPGALIHSSRHIMHSSS